MQLSIAGGTSEISIRLSGVTESTTRTRVLLVVQGFDRPDIDSAALAESGGDLADVLAEESGWLAATFDYRMSGPGAHGRALENLRLVINRVAELEMVEDVWIAGFAEGGTLALCIAAEDSRLCGAACLADLELPEPGLRAIDVIAKIPPRPILLVHGAQDEVVPLVEVRALADIAEGHAELRVVQGADHQLRHDPRAIAVLLGWLERQGMKT